MLSGKSVSSFVLKRLCTVISSVSTNALFLITKSVMEEKTVLSKVAEKIALIQFNDFLTKQDKLTQHQSGNLKNHSTETLSLLVTDHIFRAIDQQQLMAIVLVDLSKMSLQ